MLVLAARLETKASHPYKNNKEKKNYKQDNMNALDTMVESKACQLRSAKKTTGRKSHSQGNMLVLAARVETKAS